MPSTKTEFSLGELDRLIVALGFYIRVKQNLTSGEMVELKEKLQRCVVEMQEKSE